MSLFARPVERCLPKKAPCGACARWRTANSIGSPGNTKAGRRWRPAAGRLSKAAVPSARGGCKRAMARRPARPAPVLAQQWATPRGTLGAHAAAARSLGRSAFAAVALCACRCAWASIFKLSPRDPRRACQGPSMRPWPQLTRGRRGRPLSSPSAQLGRSPRKLAVAWRQSPVRGAGWCGS